MAVFSYYYPKVSRSVKFEAKSEEMFKFLRPYFAKQIDLNETGYRTVNFPFRHVERDILFKNEVNWKVDNLLNFIESLSGYQTFSKRNPSNNFIETSRAKIFNLFNQEDTEFTVNFEITLILCRKC